MSSLPSDQDITGRSFGAAELDALRDVLESGTLFAPKGRQVKLLEAAFSEWLGSPHVVACSSGSAAVHAAMAVIDPEPGDEIVTTPVTDMGALTPILYQGAIPVFADTDPDSGNITPQSVEERLSPRTRAIVVTHLFGNPADVIAIEALARRRGIPVIEDAAQAYGAEIGGRRVGTFGELATFSLQQGKHMTTGEGGLLVTSSPTHARRARLFVNKAWDYEQPTDHEFLALNYRMSELQGAVGVAQLARLDEAIDTRKKTAEILDAAIAEIDGLDHVPILEHATPSYWRYGVLVSESVPGGPVALANRLGDLGVASAPRYIKKPAYQTRVFAEQRTFGDSRWPFSLARADAVDYSDHLFTGTLDFLRRVLVLPITERHTEEHATMMSEALAGAVTELRKDAA